jgi:predicted nucleotidyltransferase
MLSEDDIVRIARRIVDGYRPLVVGTFGSHATGRAHAKSDLDIVVIQRTPEPRQARRQRVQRMIFGVMHPLDPHVFTPDEFEETAYEELSFAWVIARQARLYHWTADALRVVPSLLPRVGAHSKVQ